MPDDIKMIIGYRLKQVNDSIITLGNKNLQMKNLTVSQLHILNLLSKSEGNILPLKELEELTHSAQSTVAGIVSRLSEKEMVEYIGSPHDKRIKYAKLTELGTTVQKECREYMRNTIAESLSLLSDDECIELCTILGKILQSFSVAK